MQNISKSSGVFWSDVTCNWKEFGDFLEITWKSLNFTIKGNFWPESTRKFAFVSLWSQSVLQCMPFIKTRRFIYYVLFNIVLVRPISWYLQNLRHGINFKRHGQTLALLHQGQFLAKAASDFRTLPSMIYFCQKFILSKAV